jgi:hypothetical protein
LRTKGRSGKIKKGITVESNDPTNPKIKLTLEGEIVVDVAVTPRTITFGQLGKGETAVKNFAIKVTEPDKIKITSVKIEDEMFELVHKSGNPAGDSEYEVKFKGAKELTRISSRINIAFEGSDVKSMEVPVRVNIVGNLRYSKDIYFHKRGDTFEPREITINTRSGKPIKIIGVSDPDNKLKTKIIEQEGQTVKVLAEVADATANYDAPDRHKLIIKTTDKDEPEAEISYTISSHARTNRGMRPGSLKRGMKPFVKGADIGMAKPDVDEASEVQR